MLQIVSRAITFIANQLLLRFLTAQLLGVSTQLEVYYLSVLFFARESLRVAIQRQGPVSDSPRSSSKDAKHNGTHRQARAEHRQQSRETQTVVNLGYISIVLGAFAAVLLGWMYLSSIPSTTLATTPNLVAAVYIYALAAFLELLSEPAFVVMQIRLQFGARATAEAVATLGKCIVTLASAVWASRTSVEAGVLPFALGQLTYGAGLLIVYGWYGTSLAGREGFSMWPTQLAAGGDESGNYVLSYLYRPTVQLASSMMAQSLVKHILTQGDTFLVSILSTPIAQGVYALANNYGGLAARLVFQPVEESSRSYFSRLLSTADEDFPAIDENTEKYPKKRSGTSKHAIHQASTDLHALLKLYTLISLPLLALGPTAATPALTLVAGSRWASDGAGAALAAYVWYIPLLAINGLTEAFVASVATEAEVNRQSMWMGAFSLVFGIAGFVFMKVLGLGAVGLICANAINMACRIVWAGVFTSAYFSKRGVDWDVKGLLPSSLAVVSAAIAGQMVQRVVTADASGPRELIVQLAKIAGVTLPFLSVLYVSLWPLDSLSKVLFPPCTSTYANSFHNTEHSPSEDSCANATRQSEENDPDEVE